MGTETTQYEILNVLRQILSGLGVLNGDLDPTNRYVVHDEDSDNPTQYYGYASAESSDSWLIAKKTTASAPFTYLYANISNNPGQSYTSAWTNRATLNYTYIYNLTSV